MIESADLVPLLDLQEVDERIRRISATLKDLPQEAALATAEAERQEILPVLEERQKERARLASEQKRLDDETAGLRSKLQKEEQRLASGSVTGPREIVALQAEVESLTKRISDLEDDELEIMENAEAVEQTIAEIQVRVDTADRAVDEARRARDEAAASLSGELEDLKARREKLTPGIDPTVLARYEKLRSTQSGTVVASFDGKTCGGCGLPLSPAAREELAASNDPWFSCENCRRVLVRN